MKYTFENSIILKFVQTWHLLQIIYWSKVGWINLFWKYLVNKRWVELFYPMERAKETTAFRRRTMRCKLCSFMGHGSQNNCIGHL